MAPPPCSRCRSCPATIHFASTPRCTACFHLYLHRTLKTSLTNLSLHSPFAVALSSGPSSLSLALLLAHHISTLKHPPHLPAPSLHLLHLHTTSTPHPTILHLPTVLPNTHLHAVPLPPQPLDHRTHHTSPDDQALMHQRHIQQTLAKLAMQLGHKTILLGSSVERGTADILTALIEARGRVIPHLDDTFCHGIRFVRPMRDVEVRYLVRYARHVLGPEHPIPPANEQADLPLGMRRVVERFVGQVADGNRASVHNVVRVARKLGRGDLHAGLRDGCEGNCNGESCGGEGVNA